VGSHSCESSRADLGDAFCIRKDELGEVARERLIQRRFDQAPVVGEPNRVVGWVAKHDLKDGAAVQSAMNSLEDSAIVSLESPVGHVLSLLCEYGLVFTVGNRGLAGFIVHSDLDRQAARTYFYLLVAGIEMLLADIVRLTCTEDSVSAVLKAGAAKEFRRAVDANTETHPVEYLYLPDLIGLFLGNPRVRECEIVDEASIEWLGTVNRFRRSVMHPACSIAAARSPSEISQFTRTATDVICRLQQLFALIASSSD
jgi:CBS domain-containing protein